MLNAQEALVVQTNTRAGRGADSRTEFTTAPSVGADGRVAFIATAAWLDTFDLSSVGHSAEGERARDSAGAGTRGEVDIVEVMKHSLDFDFGPKVSTQCCVPAV